MLNRGDRRFQATGVFKTPTSWNTLLSHRGGARWKTGRCRFCRYLKLLSFRVSSFTRVSPRGTGIATIFELGRRSLHLYLKEKNVYPTDHR